MGSLERDLLKDKELEWRVDNNVYGDKRELLIADSSCCSFITLLRYFFYLEVARNPEILKLLGEPTTWAESE